MYVSNQQARFAHQTYDPQNTSKMAPLFEVCTTFTHSIRWRALVLLELNGGSTSRVLVYATQGDAVSQDWRWLALRCERRLNASMQMRTMKQPKLVDTLGSRTVGTVSMSLWSSCGHVGASMPPSFDRDIDFREVLVFALRVLDDLRLLRVQAIRWMSSNFLALSRGQFSRQSQTNALGQTQQSV